MANTPMSPFRARAIWYRVLENSPAEVVAVFPSPISSPHIRFYLQHTE